MTDRVVAAEKRVVTAAMKVTNLGAEHSGFWVAYFNLENACDALARALERERKQARQGERHGNG